MQQEITGIYKISNDLLQYIQNIKRKKNSEIVKHCSKIHHSQHINSP